MADHESIVTIPVVQEKARTASPETTIIMRIYAATTTMTYHLETLEHDQPRYLRDRSLVFHVYAMKASELMETW